MTHHRHRHHRRHVQRCDVNISVTCEAHRIRDARRLSKRKSRLLTGPRRDPLLKFMDNSRKTFVTFQ